MPGYRLQVFDDGQVLRAHLLTLAAAFSMYIANKAMLSLHASAVLLEQDRPDPGRAYDKQGKPQ